MTFCKCPFTAQLEALHSHSNEQVVVALIIGKMIEGWPLLTEKLVIKADAFPITRKQSENMAKVKEEKRNNQTVRNS